MPGLRGVRHPGQGLSDDPAPRPSVRRGWSSAGTSAAGSAGSPPARAPRSLSRSRRYRARARITTRLRAWAGRRVRDACSTVVQAARDLHLSWPTVMDAFRAQAREVIDAPLPEVEVLGIDETRRGRPRWEQDPVTGKRHLVRDRWHTGFVDALGSGCLLGQIEGRTVADVLVWLSATPLTWRKSIKYVAIDMSATYPCGRPDHLAAGRRRGRPLPRRPARQQVAVHGPAPHHRRGLRPARTRQ
ncbi:helix-turn-helix domain-containing protein [Streptomyces actuosus]|uniref:helix-turn-helix domain-containing protein n=1 Tax=Streptomyces actuosus TaxID=1885 RepID=UPI0027DA1527|nr:helix-turn-helix domain-containing protein [Streptomyces actuosus]